MSTLHLRRIAALLFVIAGANHGRLASIGAPHATRHAVFVGINVVLAIAVAFFPPRVALVLVALLSLQQLPSHGGDLIRQTPFDWASLGVVLFLPAVLVLLALDTREAKTLNWRFAAKTPKP